MLRHAVLLSCVFACGKPQGTLEITTGGEADVFTKDPKPTQIVVETFSTDGTATRIGQSALPVTTLELAEQKKDANATIRVTARDDAGNILAQGSSLLIQLGVLADHTLQIFVQRDGELARMPQGVDDAREAPMLGMLGGRYIFVVGGTLGTATQLYDLMSFVPFVNPPPMPFVPTSIVPIDTGELLISDTDVKTYDFSMAADAAQSTPAQPANGTWAEVAGGPTIEGEAGVQYVVGAARTTGAATDKILQVKPDGTAVFLKLNQARLGAATCWVPGRGLVVSGSTMGMAGLELVPANSSPLTITTMTWPAGVCAALDGARVVVATGTSATVTDLGCAPNCMPTPFGGTLANAPLQLFSSTANDIFALGDAMDGTTHAYRLSKDSSVEVPFKGPHKRARGLRLPTGAIAVVGGSNVIESFVP